ncbi:hypothetical protein [Vibrio sp. D431a]|uniref:hypothetical protein n=1 Tax=Vibrio sp. D431a TaxID=2837388 RepID=UPI0025566946|nr:hypothetical protein [Vibrio sp. D431a]MDK9793856.1 hypothetical protein [Vibrio sp. D431a]
MDFKEKLLRSTSELERGEKYLTVEEILEQIREEGEVTLPVFHGSKDFQGDTIDLSKVGSREGHRNDAQGTAFYMSTSKIQADSFAGDNGNLVIGEVVLTEDNISNIMSAESHPSLIERAILESPQTYHFMLSSFETNCPEYNFDDEGYYSYDTDELVECSLEEFIEEFGGLREIFTNRFFKPRSYGSATNPIDDYINERYMDDDLAEALKQIEADLYSPQYANDELARVRYASRLNELKSEYGIYGSLHNDLGAVVVAVTDSRLADIKEVLKVQEIKCQSTNKMTI